MAVPEQNAASRSSRPAHRSYGRRAVVLLLVTCLITGVALAGFVWWEERSLREAEAMLEAGEARKALSLVDRYLREHPDHGAALSLRARLLVANGRPQQAIDLFERVGGSTPEEMHAWAQALLQLESWTTALPILEYLKTTDVDRADVLHELTACRAKVGDYDGAIAAATEFAAQPGYAARGQLLVGTLHQERGNARQTAAAWGDVLKHDPDLTDIQIPPAEFLLAYGQTLSSIGEAEPAVELIERSLALQPQPEAYTSLGDAESHLGHTDAAEKAYRQALDLQPGETRARTGLAQLELARGDAAAAREWLAPLESSSQLTSQIAYLFQQTSTRLGDLEQAARWRAKADDLRKLERARESADQILRDTPQSDWAQVLRAYRFAQSGNWSEAELLLTPIAKVVKDQPFIQDLYHAVQTRGPLPPLQDLPLHDL